MKNRIQKTFEELEKEKIQELLGEQKVLAGTEKIEEENSNKMLIRFSANITMGGQVTIMVSKDKEKISHTELLERVQEWINTLTVEDILKSWGHGEADIHVISKEEG